MATDAGHLVRGAAATSWSALWRRGAWRRYGEPDVTAANVLLTEHGAKLIDFGICAVSGDNDTAHDGQIMGTTAYLAPERLDDQPVEPPSTATPSVF